MDRGDAGRATDAGAGILSAARDVDDPDPVERFAARAAVRYPEPIGRLEADGAGETGQAACGSLIVAASEDEAAPFEDARAGLFGRPALPRAAADVGFSEVSPERARELFPPPGRVRGAIHGARGARAVGRLLAAALRRAALGRWLEAREAGVTGLILEGGAVRGVSVGGEEIGAGHVVIAAGAWSAPFEERLGVRIPIEPQRGQIVHLDLAGMDTVGRPIASAFRGHYMVAWADGRVAVGATRETSSGFRARSTVTGVMQVLAEAVRVAPGLAGAAVREVRVGLRPLTPDGLPVLGPRYRGSPTCSWPPATARSCRRFERRPDGALRDRVVGDRRRPGGAPGSVRDLDRPGACTEAARRHHPRPGRLREPDPWRAGGLGLERPFSLHPLPPAVPVQPVRRPGAPSLTARRRPWRRGPPSGAGAGDRPPPGERGVDLYSRADAAFAKPGAYGLLETEGIRYAIRLPAA